jgi:hypothetical protein
MKNYSGINTGKICSVELLETRYIQTLMLDQEKLSATLEPIPGKSFSAIGFTPDSASLEVQEVDADDGSRPHYMISLSLKVPKLQADRLAAFYGIKSSQFVCRFSDMEGNLFLAGTQQAPAQLTLNYAIAPSPSGPNEISLQVISFTPYGLMQVV